MLKLSPEFTVWDRPWEPHEEATSSCCKPDLEGRLRVGRLRDDDEAPDARERRNPLKQIEERGGGLFELHWKERVRLLRQLVDWQCECKASCQPDASDARRERAGTDQTGGGDQQGEADR